VPAERLLFGQVEASLGVDALAAALSGEGVAAQARGSSLYTGRRYLRVHAADASCTLERVDRKEYIVRGDADDLAALVAVAERVSAALARLGLRHRLEVYEARDRLALYLHHQWPLGDAVPEPAP
jgi:hypothetical protein